MVRGRQTLLLNADCCIRGLRGKTEAAGRIEVLCKFLCHNLCVNISAMYELGIQPMFAQWYTQSVVPRNPKLDYETPPKRVRFLEKLNPKATPRTVVRTAFIYGALAAVLVLVVRHFIPNWQHMHWLAFVGLVLLGAGVGAICEWQQTGG